ncbi:hypothetical protein [Allosalinactinospora lopnorensis]|uniref:hypothetical protein n=1 Tax=Allosalinactinospora lopnorensis TaxID=1352348 RepID=UPI000623E7B9|nr:hypothetical protein [Allosalinactinospora lopnorensis]
MATGTYEYRSDFARKYYGQGMAEGEAKGVVAVLAARGIPVSKEVRERILTCTDLDQVDTWLQRALTAKTVDDLFD